MQRFIYSILKAALVPVITLGWLSGPVDSAAHGYAITDVNVITLEVEAILPHQTVLVIGDRIVDIQPAAHMVLPTGVRRIDGAGAYLLPALTDMHVHLSAEQDLIQYLRYGVTTLRNMNGTPQHLYWRDEIMRGERLGPQIVSAGPCVGELPLQWTTESISACMSALVFEQISAGYDFIKVYDYLPASAHRCLIEQAAMHGVEVVGHVPDGIPLMDVLASGQRSIEHLEGYSSIPLEELDEVIDLTIHFGVWNCPTLTIWQRLQPVEGTPGLAQQALMDYAAHNLRTQLCLPARSSSQGYELGFPSAHRLEIVARLHKAGAPLLLGTDAPMLCTVPGFSTHQELRNFVAAGLTPFEALKTATVNPAVYWNQLDERGTVSVGKQADLLLLRANPLVDISATQDIIGVMVNGQWYSVPDLR